MTRPNTRAESIKDIVGAIYGMTGILEADLVRRANEGEKAVLGEYEQGAMLAAMSHLANQATLLAESIVEDEELVNTPDAQGESREVTS
ncbi:hypothetical protein BWR19_15930 [Halomonas sp. 1513]|nr:hypothetical protein [Halomonas sp. 1513]APX94303.1 hypothetical protein BWR19_15930 [Halomonas sp. 1513]